MYPQNLIVNADDFGIDIHVSRGIADCVSKELVNSISVIAYESDEIDELLQNLITLNPHLKIGCHLALFDIPSKWMPGGTPITSYQSFLFRYMLGRVRPFFVYQQWRKQLEWLQSKNVRINHMDSHQHLHILPGMWKYVLRLQAEFNIPRIRIPYESVKGALNIHFPFGVLFQLLAKWRLSNRTDGFMGFLHSMNYKFEAYQRHFSNVLTHPQTSFELMVHPGYKPEDVRTGPGTWTASWEEEIKELEKTKAFFASHSNSAEEA